MMTRVLLLYLRSAVGVSISRGLPSARESSAVSERMSAGLKGGIARMGVTGLTR